MSGSHASSGASAARGDCPTDDVIAAHVGGKLDDVERERVSAHLDGCANCRDLVIHAVRGVHADPLAATRPADAVTTSGDSTHAEGERTSIPSVFAGRYELKRLIGTGGMGSVYEALDLNLHRLVALKVLKIAPSKPEERAEAVNRLVREARAMAVLSHKNVVVYDVGFHEDQVFVAMQLVDGLTLREWITAETRTTSQIVRVLLDAGSGLAAACGAPHSSRLQARQYFDLPARHRARHRLRARAPCRPRQRPPRAIVGPQRVIRTRPLRPLLSIDTAWQQRDLLRGDLPASFETALREADAAGS